MDVVAPSLSEAVVDLEAVAHNTRLLRLAADDADLMAVVTADGFGHGATEIARTVLDHGATWLGVATVDEALALRSAGIVAPMLLWLYPPHETFAAAVAAQVDISASSVAALEAIAAAALRLDVVADVHLRADTGMPNGGADPSEWELLCAKARRLEVVGAIRVVGLWSDLADVTDPRSAVLAAQLEAFAVFRATALRAGIMPPFVHLASSAALLRLPSTRFDLVRAGSAVYGIEPVPGRVSGLRPALSVTAKVLLTKPLPDTTLAHVSLGFADGVPRVTDGRASFLVHGVRVPVVGRIGMDRLMLDVGDLPVRPGDGAVMFGPGDRGEPTVGEWAEWSGRSPHEILTGIGPRVRRRYRPAV